MSTSFQRVYPKKFREYQISSVQKKPEEWNLLQIIDWTKPVIAEVGCGRGDWLIKQAEQFPNKIFLGIEKTKLRSDLFKNNAAKKKFPNLFAMRGDAIEVFAHCIPKQSIDELYFFYPNPWPKRKQANKRFFPAPAFQVFLNALKTNGKIYLVSNIDKFVEEAKDFLIKQWNCKLIKYQADLKIKEPRTLFEKKYFLRKNLLSDLLVHK